LLWHHCSAGGHTLLHPQPQKPFEHQVNRFTKRGRRRRRRRRRRRSGKKKKKKKIKKKNSQTTKKTEKEEEQTRKSYLLHSDGIRSAIKRELNWEQQRETGRKSKHEISEKKKKKEKAAAEE
jgi:hypothetical protein